MNSLPGNFTHDKDGPRFTRQTVRPRFRMPSNSLSSGGKKPESVLLAGATEIDRVVVTRPDIADPSIATRPVVLLTGRWHSQSNSVVELDTTIDSRFTWIDREAERLAELAGGAPPVDDANPSASWVNVLALRYYLVKLLRVIEFFSEVQPPKKGDRLCLIADGTDFEDVAIIAAICRRVGATCSVQWHGRHTEEAQSSAEQEERWRRTLRRLAGCLPKKNVAHAEAARIVLCGNPRFLDPLCRVLHERNCRLWWLYDRFAVKPYFQWASKGVHQLTCQDDSHVTDPCGTVPIELPPLEFRGVDLRDLVANWLDARLATRRHDQRRWHEQIDCHFRNIKPDLLVMDEDATPMKRIALFLARRYGGKSYVVQHGAPVARFGFAPLAADGFFAWGRSTREQLQHWEVPTDRIFVTGSPTHDTLYQALRQTPRKTPRHATSPRILLLATVPPRDNRPDLIEMNLNARTYDEMIEAAFAATESISDATLVVKPHPRAQKDPAILAAASRHPKLRFEWARTSSLAESLSGVDCVLSCLSSAGIEATLAELPVVQLVPRGAGRILPHDRWGMFGSASNAKELLPLIKESLQGQGRASSTSLGEVFANASFWQRTSAIVPDAANRIADILLNRAAIAAPAKQSSTIPRTNQKHGRSETVANR